jgi:hypothetical protein
VFGAIESCSGCLFSQGIEGRFNSESYMVSIRQLDIKSVLNCVDRLDDVGKARQRLQSGGSVGLENGAHGLGHRIERLGREGGAFVFAVAPEPFAWGELRPRGGQKAWPHLGRPAHGCGCVPSAMGAHQPGQRRGHGSGTAVQPRWERPTVEGRQCEQDTRPGRRGHSALAIARLTLVGHGSARGHPTGGNATPEERQ